MSGLAIRDIISSMDSYPKKHKKHLALLKLPEDEDVMLNRFDLMIEYINEYASDEESAMEWIRLHLELKLVECRLLYIAWRDEEY